MTKTEKAIEWMENTANNNSHGYDQRYRWGEKGDYDCSSAVITAWQNAGVPVKTYGATYTGNMYNVFIRQGFKDVTKEITLSTGKGLKRGDVLLNVKHHTAMYCGNGKEVEASINENGKATGGKPGDQTGKEFWIRPYRNYPWNYVLRYPESKKSNYEIAKEVLSGKWGNGDARKTALKNAGYDYEAVQKEVNKLTKKQKSNETIAKEVIAGKWGNGNTRKANLEKAGYNYYTIQKIVNSMRK